MAIKVSIVKRFNGQFKFEENFLPCDVYTEKANEIIFGIPNGEKLAINGVYFNEKNHSFKPFSDTNQILKLSVAEATAIVAPTSNSILYDIVFISNGASVPNRTAAQIITGIRSGAISYKDLCYKQGFSTQFDLVAAFTEFQQALLRYNSITEPYPPLDRNLYYAYVADDNKVYYVTGFSAMQALITSSHVHAYTLVWRKPMYNYDVAKSCPELTSLF